MDSEISQVRVDYVRSMNSLQVFDAKSYHEIIRSSLKENEGTRGFQSRLSEAAGCTTSYFSRVLCGRYHLNLEQAFSLCQFWGFDKKETAYFLLLILIARSGPTGLRTQLEDYLSSFREISLPVVS